MIIKKKNDYLEFQFIIGILSTEAQGREYKARLLFQFLIGILSTVATFGETPATATLVSIPYRYTINS